MIGTKEIANAVLEEVGDIARDIDLSEYDFVPWAGKFLVKRFKKEKVTTGGLHITEGSQERKNWGTVVRLPEINPPAGLDVGDIVLFLDSGLALEALGADLVLLDCTSEADSDVLGVFKKSA